MKPFVIRPISRLKGTISLLGDKSIAHRAVILSSLTRGKIEIKNFPLNKDCLATINSFNKLGVKIKYPGGKYSSTLIIEGLGLFGLKKPKGPIFIAESGTTFRLLLGVLSGQDFTSRLLAGKSLSRRPMRRSTEPLREMGAIIKSNIKYQKSKMEEFPPIVIKGGQLKGITYKMPVASAQVKGAILLAGLYAKGNTRVIEPLKLRDHTERMLSLFKAGIKVVGNKVVIEGRKPMVSPKKIYIPGDISSAAFFMVLAAIVPDSEVLIKNVSLNPTRIGVIRVLKRMGADIEIKYQNIPACRQAGNIKSGEPLGDVCVRTSKLKAAFIKDKEVPSLIDELPILMVAASFAKGKSLFEGLEELRVKETDRIKSMTDNLRSMGVDISVAKSGKQENIVVKGSKELKGAKLKSFGDHRTAMSMIVAGLAARGSSSIDDVSCISKSSPDFLAHLKALIKN
jgi:3-phosphoshikimate 1-carboxyvinyltransferase